MLYAWIFFLVVGIVFFITFFMARGVYMRYRIDTSGDHIILWYGIMGAGTAILFAFLSMVSR